MRNKTAVELCCINISQLCVDFLQNENYDKMEFLNKYNQIVSESFVIEKQQIIDAFESGQRDSANGFYNKLGVQYYNKNFNN
jgi:hypothetical protein